MTSIIEQTTDQNTGRCKVRPRRALNHFIWPRNTKASGVVASATAPAINDTAMTAFELNISPSCANKR